MVKWTSRGWRVGLLVLASVAGAGLLLRQFTGPAGPGHTGPLRFVVQAEPKQTASVAFVTGDGASMKLEDLRGKVVLLNIWATWCAPCKAEMPSLDRLQAKLGGPDFEVVALSIDKDVKSLAAVKSFYSRVGIRHLRVFHDPTGEAGYELGTVSVPTTFLIDRRGRELGRLTGTAEWDEGEALDLVRGIVAAERGRP